MGRYFNPVSELYNVGRPLCGGFLLKELTAQLQPGEYLIGCYTSMFNPDVVICHYLETNELFNHFDASYNATYWAISKADFDKYVE